LRPWIPNSSILDLLLGMKVVHNVGRYLTILTKAKRRSGMHLVLQIRWYPSSSKILQLQHLDTIMLPRPLALLAAGTSRRGLTQWTQSRHRTTVRMLGRFLEPPRGLESRRPVPPNLLSVQLCRVGRRRGPISVSIAVPHATDPVVALVRKKIWARSLLLTYSMDASQTTRLPTSFFSRLLPERIPLHKCLKQPRKLFQDLVASLCRRLSHGSSSWRPRALQVGWDTLSSSQPNTPMGPPASRSPR